MTNCKHCGEPFKPVKRYNGVMVYCTKPECRKAKYEEIKFQQRAKRRPVFQCNHCLRFWKGAGGTQRWCKHPACQADKKEYMRDYRVKYLKGHPRPVKKKRNRVQLSTRKCQSCSQYISKEDFDGGFRITCKDCREDWLKDRDVDGYFVYPQSFDYGEIVSNREARA